jgi:hypothetical protein
VEDINSYLPWFSVYEKTSTLLERLFLLEYMDGILGLHDIDNDGTEELYFLYYGASVEGLLIMDYIDNSLKVVGQIYGFVMFSKIKNKIYMLSKHIRVGPELCSTEVNDYVAYSYEDGKIIEYNKLPNEVYNLLFDKIYSEYVNKNKYYNLFFYLYNNSPEILSYQYVDEHFKSNPESDEKYISKENVKNLVDDTFSDESYDIYQTKYYYLVDTIKPIMNIDEANK